MSAWLRLVGDDADQFDDLAADGRLGDARECRHQLDALAGAHELLGCVALGGQGLLDELMAGASGAMTGFSYPEALIACVRAWQDGGYEAAQRELQPYLPLINFEQQAKVALAIRKECLRERGLIKDSGVRAPAAPFPEALRGSMAVHLKEAASALDARTAVGSF